ncbi:NAD(P)H-binding protein [Paenibacillus mucilaginosus]|uniref:YesF n=1 Tax=Paenibacillus mucilaginosus (strain KNP414) TaxID=1036673 RepID=F8FE29_PAEMK|nr:NAD(P)H-binding protein [Paenibacillus mucilaginosus]AEI43788.1 YesF [Paenibacillus mucilaginosus KNP414]MCG7212693.1 NAD(P)H-binding protein [Paenibacillus mucilaginosus]WDM25288.1 NAD(P)H-binding protein [Paenibacillus mucilaginosus]
MILVTGAAGKTGSRTASRLREMGYPVRTAGRNRAVAAEHEGEHVVFDWNEESAHEAALEGVRAVYLVGPLMVMEPAKIMIPFLEKAWKAGVRRAVLLSSASVPEGGPVFGEVHRYLREQAPEWAVLQPSYFMQNFTEGPHGAAVRQGGDLVTAAGEGRVAFVNADDIAEVAVRALTDPVPHNTAHVITGPEALTYGEAAEILSRTAGREVRHISVSPRELQQQWMALGMPEDYAAFMAGLDEGIRDRGTESRVTDTVERITGRRPVSLAEFLSVEASVF